MKRSFYPYVFSILIGIFGYIGWAHAAAVDDLITAVIRNSESAVSRELSKGANPNVRDAKGRTALTLAIHQQLDKAIPVLLQARGIDISATNGADESPLMLALITGQDDLARDLIKRGAAINKKGWTPLHYAATRGNVDLMRILLDKDAYIDTASPNHTTPLMMAAEYSGNPTAVAYLLRQGADPWMKNQLGLTPLDFARRGKNEDIIRAIQSAQRRSKPVYNARPVAPLSPASAAELKGLPIPEDPEPVEMIYPEGMEPPPPPPPPPAPAASAASAPLAGGIMAI
ncbi:MAG: ankyrin repeat domain-containing protein [Brachymonas sp.]|nr:ankyrin repeat domain-containing protein [Brachymonas sp.]